MSTPPDTRAPVVSAIVAHYGDPTVAHRAVSDLQAQKGAHSLEVIVVDDCSPVPFPEHPGVITLRRNTNGGFGAAVNSGAAVATGNLIMIVNSDIRMAPDFLDRLMREAAPLMPAVVGPSTTTLDGHYEPTGRRFPTAAHWVLEGLIPLQRYSDREWFQRAIGRVHPRGGALTPVDWLQGSLLLMPLSSFRAVGGFDERFFLYSEEVDLQRRLQAIGVRSWLLPSVGVVHSGGASTDSGSSHEWLTRSRVTYSEKWGGLARLRAAMWATAALNLVTRSALRLTGRRTAPRMAWRREVRIATTRPWPSHQDHPPNPR